MNDDSSSRRGYAFYRDVFGDWRWEYYDATGEAFDSRESFETERECIENAGTAGARGNVIPMRRKPTVASSKDWRVQDVKAERIIGAD
jgi:hypothetical protein